MLAHCKLLAVLRHHTNVAPFSTVHSLREHSRLKDQSISNLSQSTLINRSLFIIIHWSTKPTNRSDVQNNVLYCTMPATHPRTGTTCNLRGEVDEDWDLLSSHQCLLQAIESPHGQDIRMATN